MVDQELLTNYLLFKKEISAAVKKSDQTVDTKEAWEILKNVQNRFKEFKLQKEHREELFLEVQLAFQRLISRQEKEREAFVEESNRNYHQLKAKISEATIIVNYSTDWKSTKEMLIELQNQFRGLKLLREQRDELYAQLQECFTKVSQMQETEKTHLDKEIALNYVNLKEKIDIALEKVKNETLSKNQAWEILIEVQNDFKGLRLYPQQRDELYRKLQSGFELFKKETTEIPKKENENIAFQNNYIILKEKVDILCHAALNSNELSQIKLALRELQREIKDAPLLSTQRDEFYKRLQESYQIITQRQEGQRTDFEKQARENKIRLQEKLKEGLEKAEKSTEYKETRNFLISIQNDFKYLKLLKDDREQLYIELQKAFQTLNQRIDEYFRTKKKDWEAKMQYKINYMQGASADLEKQIKKLKSQAKLLKEQLENEINDEIQQQFLTEQYETAIKTIEEKKTEILTLTENIENLKNQLNS